MRVRTASLQEGRVRSGDRRRACQRRALVSGSTT